MRALEAPVEGEEAVPSKRWATKTPVAKATTTEEVSQEVAE
jgi:hypothetical protein